MYSLGSIDRSAARDSVFQVQSEQRQSRKYCQTQFFTLFLGAAKLLGTLAQSIRVSLDKVQGKAENDLSRHQHSSSVTASEAYSNPARTPWPVLA
jgi:hypothetical protein